MHSIDVSFHINNNNREITISTYSFINSIVFKYQKTDYQYYI